MRATKFKSLSDTGSSLTCYRQVGRLRDFPSENARGKLLLDGRPASPFAPPGFLRGEGPLIPPISLEKFRQRYRRDFRYREGGISLSLFLFSVYAPSFRILDGVSFDSRLNKDTER